MGFRYIFTFLTSYLRSFQFIRKIYFYTHPFSISVSYLRNFVYSQFCLNCMIKFTKLFFTDLLVRSFLLEFPLHKCLRIWSACICGIHFVFFPLPVSSASAKWTASCFHPPLGCSYICIQCRVCTSEWKNWQGNFNKLLWCRELSPADLCD